VQRLRERLGKAVLGRLDVAVPSSEKGVVATLCGAAQLLGTRRGVLCHTVSDPGSRACAHDDNVN
jgi:hypothetical protein